MPYNPGTQYQICMFASNGVSGGCQRLTTVIPKANTSLNDPPTCTNLTYPQAILDVAANDHTGNLCVDWHSEIVLLLTSLKGHNMDGLIRFDLSMH